MWKNFAKEYFTFTRKERIGIYTLLGIIFLCIIIPFFFPFFIHQRNYDKGEFEKAVSELKIKEDPGFEKTRPARNYSFHKYTDYKKGPKSYEPIRRDVFYFDPNTITVADWRRLGLREKTIATIEKYLGKGGHFYKAADISKIWGLREDEIKRLLPYIQINNKTEVASYTANNAYKEYKPFHKAEQRPFDINTADSARLDSLPGIGPKLAKRILAFRDKLGGFISVNQVKETYALPDSTFYKIRSKLFIGNNELKKININSCAVEQLKAHPYIRYAIANAIIQYRTQHGSFNSVSDLKNIMIVSDSIYDKISPYITVK